MAFLVYAVVSMFLQTSIGASINNTDSNVPRQPKMLPRKVKYLEDQLIGFEKSFTNLEDKLVQEFTSHEFILNGSFTDLEEKVASMEETLTLSTEATDKNIASIGDNVAVVDGKVADVDAKTIIIEEKIDDLKEMMSRLDEKFFGFEENLNDIHQRVVSCPVDFSWDQDINLCFKVFRGFGVVQSKAREVCLLAHPNGRLVEMNTQRKYEVVRDEAINSYNDRNYFIGLERAADGSINIWSDGSVVDVNLWMSDNPDNAGGGEHCVELVIEQGYLLNDCPCTHSIDFICEVPMY